MKCRPLTHGKTTLPDKSIAEINVFLRGAGNLAFSEFVLKNQCSFVIYTPHCVSCLLSRFGILCKVLPL